MKYGGYLINNPEVKDEQKSRPFYIRYKWIHKPLLPAIAQTLLSIGLLTTFSFKLFNLVFLGFYISAVVFWIFVSRKVTEEGKEVESKVKEYSIYFLLAKTEMRRFQVVQNVMTEFLSHDIGELSKIRSSLVKLFSFDGAERIRKIIKEMADTLKDIHDHKIEAISAELDNKTAEDLFIDYRITLMIKEKHGSKEILITKYWSCFSGRIPRIVQENIELQKGEGVAGTAWSQGQAKYIPSISKARERAEDFKVFDYGMPMQTKSMMSYPLFNEYGRKREFFGILNIDSTKEEHFMPPGKVNHDDIEIITPLIRQLIFYLKINELGELLKNNYVINPK